MVVRMGRRRAPWPKTALQWLHIGMVGLLLHGVYLGGVCIAISKGLHAGVTSLVVGAAPADWRTGAVAQFLPTALATGVFAAVGKSFHVDWTGLSAVPENIAPRAHLVRARLDAVPLCGVRDLAAVGTGRSAEWLGVCQMGIGREAKEPVSAFFRHKWR